MLESSSYSYSKQRVMNGRRSSAMEKFPSNSVMTSVTDFFGSVEAMNQTIMVPSRLVDIEITDDEVIPPLLQSEKDIYSVYKIINNTKNSLLYGVSINEQEDDELESTNKKPTRPRRDTAIDRWSSNTSSNSSPSRRESAISMASVNSTYNSDSNTDSDEGEDEASDGSDSAYSVDESNKKMGAKLRKAKSVLEATDQVRNHLVGLQSCLRQLSDSACFITELYREDLLK